MIIMIIRLRIGGNINHPIMFLSLHGLWPQMVQQWFLTLIQQVEMEMPMEMEMSMAAKMPVKWNYKW